jgi:hypothetical protein
MSMPRRSRDPIDLLCQRLNDIWCSIPVAEVAKGDCDRVVDDWVAERLLDCLSNGSPGLRIHGVLEATIRHFRGFRRGDFMEGGVPSEIARIRQDGTVERLAMWQHIARRFP